MDDNRRKNKVNLTEISNELYSRQQRREGIHGGTDKNKLSNFMSKNSRYLSEIKSRTTSPAGGLMLALLGQCYFSA